MIFRISSAAKLGFAAVALVAAAFAGTAPANAGTIKTGLLTCKVAGGVGMVVGSSKGMSCTFKPDFRGPELYGGRIDKLGLDIGVTGRTVMVWAVLAPGRGYPVGALAGRYVGASAEASVVIGAGANVLVGGSNRSFALQPVSVQGQTGLDLAVTLSALELWAE
jgi:hypothetical protein